MITLNMPDRRKEYLLLGTPAVPGVDALRNDENYSKEIKKTDINDPR